MMKHRDFHRLAMIRGETRGYTTTVPSKKVYSRKIKHKITIAKESATLH
jgi:hypothetical protein